MLMIPERSSGSFYPCHRSPFPSICIRVTPRRAWPKPYIDRMISLFALHLDASRRAMATD